MKTSAEKSEYNKRYHALHRERRLIQKKEWRQKNREKIADQKAQYWKRFPERLKAAKRREYLRHADKYKARSNNNYRNKPYWFRQYEGALGRARKRGVTIVDLASIKEFFRQVYTQVGGICEYCRGLHAVHELTVEHKQPYILGGMHCISNFAISCHTCNARKGRKPYDLWIAQITEESVGGLSQ